MSNEIRIRSNLTAIQEVTETTGGNTYTKYAIDSNADRAFGGKYDTLTAYTDDDIARWSDAVVKVTSYDGFDNHDWTEASSVTDGTLPTNVYAVAVEYVKELGTVGTVDIRLSLGSDTVQLASLDLGEACVIPLSGGLPPSKIEIRAGAYSDGTNEATVNVLLLGT